MTEKKKTDHHIGREWIRFLPVFVIFSLLLFTVSFFVLPTFQKAVSQKVIERLNEGFDGELSYNGIQIRGKQISLIDFMMVGYCQDTIISLDTMQLDVNIGPFGILSKKYKFSNVQMIGGFYHQKIHLGDTLPNMTLSINPEREFSPERSSLNLIFRDVVARDFCFTLEDENLAQRIDICSNQLQVQRLSYENRNNHLHFEHAFADGLQSTFRKYKIDEQAVEYGPRDPNWTYLTLELTDVLFCSSGLTFNNYQVPFQYTHKDAVDYAHFDLSKMDLSIQHYRQYLLDFQFEDFSLSGEEKSGLTVQQIAGSSLEIDSTGMEWRDMIIATDQSNIQGILKMHNTNGYSSWLNFAEEVRMEGISTSSYLTFSDLYFFAPELKKNTFISQNKKESFLLSGRFQGNLNRLRIRDIKLKRGSQSKVEGQLTLRDITDPKESFISLRIENMYSDVRTITELFPDLRIPRSFNRLGRFQFEGSFDGSPSDFIAYGFANTGLGVARLDINVENLNKDLETNFSGELSLVDFDMKNWLENDELGKMTMTAEVALGKGLKLENAEATLDAVIEYIDYKGYRYKDIKYAGRFSQRILDGKGEIVDDNIKLNYDGVLQRRDSSYTVNAKIKLQDVHLDALNLSEGKAIVSTTADLNFKTNKLLDFIGYAKLDSLHLETEDTENTIGNVDIYSLEYGEGQHLNVIGDGFDLRIDGDFRLIDFYKPMLNTFNDQNTKFRDLLKIPRFTKIEDGGSQFEIQLKLDSLIGWPRLLRKDMGRLDDLDLFLAYDQEYDYIRLESSTRLLDMGPKVIYKPNIYYEVQGRTGEAKLKVDSIQMGESSVPPLDIAIEKQDEQLQFAVLSTNIYAMADYVNMTGEISRQDSFYVFTLNDGLLALFNDYWNIAPGNYLMVSRNSIRTKNFKLKGMNGQNMSFKSLGDKGIKVELSRFDLSPVNAFIPIEALQIGGTYQGSVSVRDLFNLQYFDIELSSDNFQINQDSYGKMSLNASAENLKSILIGDFNIQRDSARLQSHFEYYFEPAKDRDKKYTEVWTDIENYPATMLEYFAGSSIEQTEGNFDAGFKVFGYPQKLHLDGMLHADEFSTTVDYLNNRIFLTNQSFTLRDSMIACNKCLMRDIEGNTAVINGGIAHEFLNDLNWKVQISSDNFMALNTEKGLNQYYYGKAYGAFEADIQGPLPSPKLVIDAKSKPGTDLIFPLTAEQFTEERRFIQFGKPDTTQNGAQSIEKSGLTMELNLQMTEDADIKIIFDEQAGDRIDGHGKGNVNIVYDESGQLKVYGNYDITEGRYLFTYLNFVNKPFILREGGNIQFTGDPYNAQLKVRADYQGLSTPVFPLIQEYVIQDPRMETLAKSPTPVDLSMLLSDDLLSPTVNFEINFPELDRQLRNFAEAKLTAMDNLQNELNRQVFGLLVVGTFLPGQQLTVQGTQLVTGLNTVSQMISNQLSNYLTGLVSDLIQSDNSILSGFELDLNASFYNSRARGVDDAFNSSEIIVRPRFYLLDDRVTLDVAGNYNNSAIINNGNNITGNFVLGIDITEDRRWKFRAYQRFEPDFDGSDRSKTGIGFSYRRDFESFRHFVGLLNDKHQEMTGSQ